MTELFDSYRSNYRDVVQSSIDFSGLPHSFFMRAKADLLRELIARRLGPEKPAMLDVGCGVGSFHPLLRGMVGRLSGIDVSSASIAQVLFSIFLILFLGAVILGIVVARRV